MSERDYVRRLMVKLKKIKKSWWYKIPDPARCPKCGTIGLVNKRPFDIIGVVNGRGVAIEVKSDKGKVLSDHQVANLYLVEGAGGVSFVTTPSAQTHLLTALRNL